MVVGVPQASWSYYLILKVCIENNIATPADPSPPAIKFLTSITKYEYDCFDKESGWVGLRDIIAVVSSSYCAI